MDNPGSAPAGDEAPAVWRAIGRSVMGASHTRSGKPNQDALGWTPQSGRGTALVLAVADGHGSGKCFRSDRGSHLAVATALAELTRLLESREAGDLSAVKRLAQERLPQAIVHHWRQAVDTDLAANPLSDGELSGLAQAESEAASQLVAAQPVLAYGSTLLTVAVTPAYILYVQIGDGDILTVSESGQVARPVSSDHRLFANETTSLCTPESWKDFRVTFQAHSGTLPALILLSSDGYANSFKNESSFLQVGSDIYQMVVADGLDQVETHLEQWLNESSHEGSGDDITLGVLQREGFVARPASSSVRKTRRPEATLRMPTGGDAATVALPRPPIAPRAVTARLPAAKSPLPQTLPYPASPPPMPAAAPAPSNEATFPAAVPIPGVAGPRRRGRRRLLLLIAAFVALVLGVAAFIGIRLLNVVQRRVPLPFHRRIVPHAPPLVAPPLTPLAIPPITPAKPHRKRHHSHPHLAINSREGLRQGENKSVSLTANSHAIQS